MDFTTGSEVPTGDVTAGAEPSSKSVAAPAFPVTTDPSRDALLTDFGKATLDDRYLLPGESYQDLFARVARPMPTTPRMRSASTTTSRSCGSCRRPRCCPTAAPAAACRSAAI
jgi:hypothetical protein